MNTIKLFGNCKNSKHKAKSTTKAKSTAKAEHAESHSYTRTQYLIDLYTPSPKGLFVGFALLITILFLLLMCELFGAEQVENSEQAESTTLVKPADQAVFIKPAYTDPVIEIDGELVPLSELPMDEWENVNDEVGTANNFTDSDTNTANGNNNSTASPVSAKNARVETQSALTQTKSPIKTEFLNPNPFNGTLPTYDPTNPDNLQSFNPHINLSDEDRRTILCMVAGEAGNFSYTEKCYVAQCIKNGMNLSAWTASQVRANYRYSGWKDIDWFTEANPTMGNEVYEAVSAVFDRDENPTELLEETKGYYVLYFYCPKYGISSWHESLNFCYEFEDSGSRFFSRYE